MNTKTKKTVCIFCGHRSGKKNIWVKFARKLGFFLGKNNFTVVYGAGSRGIMGEVASTAKENGAIVHGIITKRLLETEPILNKLDQITIVDTLSERKEELVKYCDMVLILPGGIGTMDEFFDLWTKIQLGIENKPLIIANINNYYSMLLSFIEHIIKEDFFSKTQLSNIRICNDLQEIITELQKLIIYDEKNLH